MAKETDKTPKKRGSGIGDAIRDLLRAGKTNPDILEAIKKKFPDANTSLSSINWYRGKLRAEGEKVPSGRELNAAKKVSKPVAKTVAKPVAKKVVVAKKKVNPLD